MKRRHTTQSNSVQKQELSIKSEREYNVKRKTETKDEQTADVAVRSGTHSLEASHSKEPDTKQTIQLLPHNQHIGTDCLGEHASLPKLKDDPTVHSDMSVHVVEERRWPVKFIPLIRWVYNPDTPAFGMYVDDERCLIGDNFGLVVDFSLDGHLRKQYQLPHSVLSIKRDGEFLYVGCDDGGLYDLTFGELRLVARVESSNGVTAIDIKDGKICVCDHRHLTLANYEGEVIWKKVTGSGGRIVCLDGKSVYHGNSTGVTRYAVSGKRLWRRTITWFISAIQKELYIYAAGPYNVYKLHKRNGKTARIFDIDSGLELGIDSACIEVGDGIVFVTTRRSISCFDDNSGLVIYTLNTGHIEPLAMNLNRGRLYCASCTFCVLDLRMDAVVNSTIKETRPDSIKLQIDSKEKILKPLKRIESITEANVADDGVIVHCVKEGDKLRVRPLSSGYHADWNCQFPRDIRREGAQYLVDRLVVGSEKFYRAFGAIKQIEIGIKLEPSSSK